MQQAIALFPEVFGAYRRFIAIFDKRQGSYKIVVIPGAQN
jgi:hypothetical protein